MTGRALHWLAGPENASLWVADHPAEMQALARIHEGKALRLLELHHSPADALGEPGVLPRRRAGVRERVSQLLPSLRRSRGAGPMVRHRR